MDQSDSLTDRFEAQRDRLQGVAYRMLGSRTEAEDAVQEAWLRLNRTDAGTVENLGAWLTTVVSRVCLNMLQARRTRARQEVPISPEVAEVDEGADPEREALLADSIGIALLIVLDTLAPAERVAFVLHDMFAVPFEEIGPILDRSPVATRQLASRARRRVQGANTVSDVDPDRQRQIVTAFLAASRNRDYEALIGFLDPEVVVRADAASVNLGAEAESRGREAAVAFFRRAQALRTVLVDGLAGGAWMPGGRLRVVVNFTITAGRIVAVDLTADQQRLRDLRLSPV